MSSGGHEYFFYLTFVPVIEMFAFIHYLMYGSDQSLLWRAMEHLVLKPLDQAFHTGASATRARSVKQAWKTLRKFGRTVTSLATGSISVVSSDPALRFVYYSNLTNTSYARLVFLWTGLEAGGQVVFPIRMCNTIS